MRFTMAREIRRMSPAREAALQAKIDEDRKRGEEVRARIEARIAAARATPPNP